MEIMNYKAMLENAKVVDCLTKKTIECSKDYVNSKKDNIIEGMIDYIYNTLKDLMELGMTTEEFVREIQGYLRGNLWISRGPFGGDGEGARLQVHFSRFDSVIRYYMWEGGYWVSQHRVNDDCLEYLMNHWEQYKMDLDAAIKHAINIINQRNQHKLKEQLKLHEAVKNFKV